MKYLRSYSLLFILITAMSNLTFNYSFIPITTHLQCKALNKFSTTLVHSDERASSKPKKHFKIVHKQPFTYQR